MGIAICYESLNGTKLYYSKNGGSLTANKEKASIYPTLQDAKLNLAKIKPDSFPKQYKNVIPQLKIVEMSDSEDRFKDVVNQYLKMDIDEFKQQVESHLDFIGAISFLQEQLKNNISEIDSAEVQDFMHIIEFGELDVDDSISVIQALQHSRKMRRQFKLKQAILSSLAKNTTIEGTTINFKIIDDVNKVIKNQAKDKKWTFKNENLEHYFSYLLERTGNYAKKEAPNNPVAMKLAK